MLTLPPVAPVVGWRLTTRLARDHYVRQDSNDYSVHPRVIGRRVEVVADTDRVQVHHDGRLVASNARCWAAHQSITDPVHAVRQAATDTAAGGVNFYVDSGWRSPAYQYTIAHRFDHIGEWAAWPRAPVVSAPG